MEMDCNKIYNKILTDEEFMEINSMEAVTIHSSIIMIIWNCLIFIVLSGTGTENLSFYMWSPDKLHAE